MSRTADHPARPGGFVGHLAHAERDAFAGLHQTLVQGAADLRVRLPDPRGTDATIAAALVGVWWLIRLHTAPDADGAAWTAGIASQRASERRRADDQPETGCGASPGAPGHIWQAPPRRSQPNLTALLDQHRPTGPPARHETGPSGGASAT